MNMEQEVIHILQMKRLNDIIILGNMLAVILFCLFCFANICNSPKLETTQIPFIKMVGKIIFTHKIERHYLIIKTSEPIVHATTYVHLKNSI